MNFHFNQTPIFNLNKILCTIVVSVAACVTLSSSSFAQNSFYLPNQNKNAVIITPSGYRSLFNCSQATSDGVYSRNYDSGSIYQEMPCRGGKKSGVFQQYYPDGQLWKKMNYINDQLEGTSEHYYQGGSLKLSMNYNSGKKEEVLLEYYEEGSIRKEEFYIQDKKNGLSKTYFPQGQLHVEINYISGKAQGIPLKFDSQGNSMMSATYENVQTMRSQVSAQLSAIELQNISQGNNARNVRIRKTEQRENNLTKNERFWK